MASTGSLKRKNESEDDSNKKKTRLATQATDVVMEVLAMDADMQHAPETTSRADVHREGDEAIDNTLIALKESMAAFRDNLNLLPLEVAISLLQCTLKNETYSKETRSVLYHHLRRALLTRYSFFGCIEDLERCSLEEEGIHIKVAEGITRHDVEQVEEVHCAIELINECRQCVDTTTLDGIIRVAEESIQLYTEGNRIRRAELLIILGHALIIKCLNHRFGELELTYVKNKFHEAKLLSGGNVPFAYISLMALAHIGWIRVTEYGDVRGMVDVKDCTGMAQAIDEKGATFFELGTKMTKEAVEVSQLQEAITHLFSSLSCRVQPHPKRPSTLNNLFDALWTRFSWKGDLKDLEVGIFFLNQEGVRLKSPHHPDRALWVNKLANALATRFQKKGMSQDLEECIMLHREALNLRPSPHPLRGTSLNNMASTLRIRFEMRGVFQDLEESISLYLEALDALPPLHPLRSTCLSNLANALLTRYKQKGVVQDLGECILSHREALDLRPAPHPLRSTSLNDLASALSLRFEQRKAPQDLDECILLCREALDLRPPPHPDRSRSLNNLANSLCTRFKQKGAFQDLEECILLDREALDLQPPPHPLRSTSLNNLACLLSTRFKQKGTFQDLEESILLDREALDLRPPPHPDRWMSLNNLAVALSTCFKQKGVFQDLEECILLHREALDLRPPPHPDRWMSLNNLANALSTNFEHQGSPQDLEECILLGRAALDLMPSPHPDRSASLSNLAISLLSRYSQSNDNTDLEQAFHYLESASRYETGSVLDRLTITKKWAASARAYRPSAALNAYLYVLEILPLLASVDLTLKQRNDVLEHSQGIVGDAAQWAINQNHYENAIIFLSTGRSTFWSQTLQLRTSVDEVATIHPILAQRYLDVSRTLEEASRNTEQRFNMNPASNVEPSKQSSTNSLSSLASEWHQTIEKIRLLPGCENFLLPPSFLSLQWAARSGPVVLLNASEYGCDALIMRGTNPVVHVTLSKTTVASLDALRLLNRHGLAGGLGSMKNVQPEIRNAITALQGFLPQGMYLDLELVHPVVAALNLEKSDLPTRIWWCPSGAFASLPIHAAGIYSDGKEIECLFQYAVSSYITSPQDLLHPLPQISPAYKITAIIEPEAYGGSPLPATRDELQRIKAHVPDPNQLIARVGTETRNWIDDVISDIQQSSIVHFGCHGIQQPSDPLDSCLLLSGGRLTMARIIKECQTSKTAALAYLSASDTAKGDKDRPDESLNLVAPMMFAGFRSVVGTMWSIFDSDAPIVADVFYGHLFRHGMEKPPDVRDAAYGLHLATAELRKQGRGFQSWVPFVHYGI